MNGEGIEKESTPLSLCFDISFSSLSTLIHDHASVGTNLIRTYSPLKAHRHQVKMEATRSENRLFSKETINTIKLLLV